MAKYKGRGPQVIEATQWFKNGDHPNDGNERFTEGEFTGEILEGKVVRCFRHRVSEDYACVFCGKKMNSHGWIDVEFQSTIPDANYTVCPGDYIITDPNNLYFSVSRYVFEETFEKIQDEGEQNLDQNLTEVSMTEERSSEKAILLYLDTPDISEYVSENEALESSTPEAWFCPFCGEYIHKGASLCEYCGKKIIWR